MRVICVTLCSLFVCPRALYFCLLSYVLYFYDLVCFICVSLLVRFIFVVLCIINVFYLCALVCFICVTMCALFVCPCVFDLRALVWVTFVVLVSFIFVVLCMCFICVPSCALFA